MFKSTNSFFKKVLNGNVAKIDIENYIYIITEQHEPSKLIRLLRDLEYFIFLKTEEIESNITQKDWENKIKFYQEKGEEIPIKISKSPINIILNNKNGNKELEETFKYYDIEKIFYPYELFTIRNLKEYINYLIKNDKNTNHINTKHENIFSNNGFILFEHILKEYIKPIGTKGRLSDIHFFYWSMYNNKPQLIHQRPERFKEWFFETYNKEDLGKIKTLKQVENPNRKKHYSNALDWFKTQSF